MFLVCALQSIAHANISTGAVANRLSTSLMSSHATNKVQSYSSGRHKGSASQSQSQNDERCPADSISMPAISLKKSGTFPKIRAGSAQEDEEDSADHSISMPMSAATWNSPQSLVQSG